MGVGFTESGDGATWEYWDEEGGDHAAAAVPEPWDISVDGDTVSFSDCIYRRGPVTLAVAVSDYIVTGADGNVYLAAKINTETGAAEIMEGSNLASVSDAAVPADPLYVKVPLYKLIKTTDGATVRLAVASDYRNAMNLTLYV